AAIAGSDPWKTGWTAFKFAKLLYVVPVLFAFTPQILFEGKPLLAPEINDSMMGAMILEVQANPGDTVEIGDPVLKVMDGEEIREITANRDGIIKKFTVAGGGYLDSGAVVAEMSAKPTNIASSMFSALLGTLAFSALTMGYFIRKTNLIEWLILAVATVLLYWPTLISDGAGLVLVAIVYISQKARNKRDEAAGLATGT
ncbi:MAG: TRAP transporter permease, partial [Woeseiaceae bacterium]|nr:TRAP transporter permease [Woeseiaceae bacterium]